MPQSITLFGTDHCHLCEQAKALLIACEPIQSGQITIEIIDISEHPEWFEKYSVRIPVVYHQPSQAELGWPFDQKMLAMFADEVIAKSQK